MTRTDPPPSRIGSEYDNFLFSSIGEDSNGLMLSVASMLARLNLDPWHEAAQFAGLPVRVAAQKLTTLIAALPDQAFKQFDPAALASRLVELLPRHHPTKSAIPDLPRSLVPGSTLSRRHVIGIVLFVLFLGFLAAQYFLSSPDPPSQTMMLMTCTSICVTRGGHEEPPRVRLRLPASDLAGRNT